MLLDFLASYPPGIEDADLYRPPSARQRLPEGRSPTEQGGDTLETLTVSVRLTGRVVSGGPALAGLAVDVLNNGGTATGSLTTSLRVSGEVYEARQVFTPQFIGHEDDLLVALLRRL